MRRIGLLQSITREALFRLKKINQKHNVNASDLAYYYQKVKLQNVKFKVLLIMRFSICSISLPLDRPVMFANVKFYSIGGKHIKKNLLQKFSLALIYIPV